ncbi:hypothetical protein QBC37DRAFT_202816 [Rhypophila decipiens]|uniref:Uncharacterized protein n=1 Tax=Rhypophila decipiens TaxID=261697 RepID=A0AAN7B8H7_9PEZI|nr:hypothetical protein QBC37DRAFT_202816 [Rhypophila decipiens]
MVGCGGLAFDVQKPQDAGKPKPFNDPVARSNPVHRRPTYHNPTLRSISYKAQNPSSITFRDVVILLFCVYAFGWQGYLTAQKIYALGFVYPVERVCSKLSVGGCLWASTWMVVVDILGRGWAAAVVPWAFVAALGVFVGEELLGWTGSRA